MTDTQWNKQGKNELIKTKQTRLSQWSPLTSESHGSFWTRQPVKASGRQLETKVATLWSNVTKKHMDFVPTWLQTSAVRSLWLCDLGQKAWEESPTQVKYRRIRGPIFACGGLRGQGSGQYFKVNCRALPSAGALLGAGGSKGSKAKAVWAPTLEDLPPERKTQTVTPHWWELKGATECQPGRKWCLVHLKTHKQRQEGRPGKDQHKQWCGCLTKSGVHAWGLGRRRTARFTSREYQVSGESGEKCSWRDRLEATPTTPGLSFIPSWWESRQGFKQERATVRLTFLKGHSGCMSMENRLRGQEQKQKNNSGRPAALDPQDVKNGTTSPPLARGGSGWCPESNTITVDLSEQPVQAALLLNIITSFEGFKYLFLECLNVP